MAFRFPWQLIFMPENCTGQNFRRSPIYCINLVPKITAFQTSELTSGLQNAYIAEFAGCKAAVRALLSFVESHVFRVT